MKTVALLCGLGLTLTLTSLSVRAQGTLPGYLQNYTHAFKLKPQQRVYWTGGADGPIASFSQVKNNAGKVPSDMRFSLFFNIGVATHYDFNSHVGVFSGLNLKNIGLITRQDSIRLKRRVYTLGVPLGLKLGDLDQQTFFFLGGQYELALNYKEKTFIDGHKTGKFNEWFSPRTPLLMPSLFAGFEIRDFSLKFQYYPQPFFNRDFSQTVHGSQFYPYKDLKANLFFVTFGYNFSTRDTSR
ncbi:hypothetical protein [Compostibacter hankyongensis]|uniref:Outer membrane protein beta-barrel domain-containing protein n=1 Tax=Compostibacter hankyongensis TaxID=1007089 RepID=A0ABP8FGJ0_9BACT